MKRLLRPRLIWPLLLVALLCLPRPAAAHPLGNFTINVYSRLEVGRQEVAIRYIVDMAEIPTLQQFGAAPTSPTTADLEQRVAALGRGIQLQVDGASVPLRSTDAALRFEPGQGGLVTTRVEARFVAAVTPLAASAERTIAFADANYGDRLGWREVIAVPGADVRLVSSDVPAADRSAELRRYPDDMLQSPLDVRAARLTVSLGASRSQATTATVVSSAAPTDRFAALIAQRELGPAALLVSLLLAVGLGALHALAPGHGKTIVAAYLVGARGTARHALLLGLTVTVTHTVGVFALGLVTLSASRYILPEQLYPWLSVLSGGLVLAMGVALLRQRLRALRAAREHARHHAHGHEHDHDHEHGHDHEHEHDHGFGPHRHALPPADSGRPTTRSLLALGISGGLVPCPSALVVMLSAISLGRAGLGLLLILAFSVGLAGVLTGVGLLFVRGGAWLGRRGTLVRHGGAVARAVPLASAALVTTAGLVVTAQAVLQAGWLR